MTTRGKSGSNSRKAAAPIFTPTQRRKVIDERLTGLAAFVEQRGGEVNEATAYVLRENSAMLAESYGQVAESHVWAATVIDNLLTGGVWGQFVFANMLVLIQVGLIRGWINPANLPPPLQFFAPPPSPEVREAAAKAQAGGASSGPASTPPPPPPPTRPAPGPGFASTPPPPPPKASPPPTGPTPEQS